MNQRVKGWANERRSGWLREGMREPQGGGPEGGVGQRTCEREGEQENERIEISKFEQTN